MISSPNIQQLIEQNRFHDAVEELNKMINNAEAGGGNEELEEMLMMRGKLRWRLGLMREAIGDYERALELNPESEARTALEYYREIIDFFNPDLLNP